MRSLGIRAATVLDVERLAAVHAQSWHETYRGLLPDEQIESKAERMTSVYAKELAEPDGTSYWVATWDGEIIGFAAARALGPGDVRLLELSSLYVLAEHQGKGIGSILLNYAVGTSPCLLWVLEGHDQAIGFYRHHDFETDGTQRSVEALGGANVLRMVR